MFLSTLKWCALMYIFCTFPFCLNIFQDVLVDKDFDTIFEQVRAQLPGVRMRHGGTEPPLKPKVRAHPMLRLMTYIDKNKLRLVDFFNKFDKDGSMSVTHEEFKQGLSVSDSVISFLCQNINLYV